MRPLRLLVAAATLLVGTSLAAPATAGSTSSSWAAVRAATAPLHDLQAANHAG